MTTTCQAIIDRAKAFNPLNASLAADPTEMLSRIQQMQQRVFTALAKLRRPRFSTLQSVNSTLAALNRSIDLSVIVPPVERVLKVSLAASGLEVFQISEFDPNAQISPRYYVRGQSLNEYSNDWGTNGVVTINLLYIYGATPISTAGNTTQLVSIPDEWADVLILPLARYFHQKDPGRDPAEYATLGQQYVDVWNGFMSYLTNYAGDIQRKELLPAPPEMTPPQPS